MTEKTAHDESFDKIDLVAVPPTQNIPGYPGYVATADGDIVALRNGKAKRQRAANGGLRVDIGKSARMVHDLVARAFWGHPLVRGFRVKHRNGDTSDNRAVNLLWAGAPIYDEPNLPPPEIQRAYEEAERKRLDLIELMQP